MINRKMFTMFILVIISLAILLGMFFVVIYQNSESKTLVFAFSTIVGATCLFVLNMFFELRDSPHKDVVQTQISIFHDRPEVAPWLYPPSSKGRIHLDKKASDWLANKDPSIFKKEPLRIKKDLLMYSLVGFFLNEENDWKKTSKSFVGLSKSFFRTKEEQKGNDTFVSKESFAKMLSDSENVFANVTYNVIVGGVFLPPKSKLIINKNVLHITNPFCSISFSLEESGAISYCEPGSRVAHAETMDNGTHKHETRYFNINIDVLYKGLRSSNKMTPEYKRWIKRLVKNAHGWFEMPPIKS